MPGGKLDLQEDFPLMAVSCVHWYEKKNILILCFADNHIRFFRIRGMLKHRLDIEQLPQNFLCPFHLEYAVTGIHQITREFTIILAGDLKILPIYGDPDHPLFL
jgi:hypothetical protein